MAQEAVLQFDHAFMHSALSKAKVTERDCTYQSVRLTGRRPAMPATATTPATSAREVHVFEMYWADLSRLVPHVFRFLSEFYLLLFFVCQLGRKSVDASLASHPREFWWRTLRFWLAWAERLFTRFISVLNLYLLAIVVILVPLSLDPKSHPLIAIGVTAVLVLVGAFLLLQKRCPPEWWPAAFLVGSVAAGIAAFLVVTFAFASATYVAVLMSWAAAVLISLRLMWAFQQRQPGVFAVTVVVGIAASGLLVWFMPRHGATKDFIDAGLWTAEYIWAALALLWTAFGLASLLTGVAGCMTLMLATDKLRSWRVVWTAATALTVPPTLFLILTLALWTALLQAGAQWLPHHQQHALTFPFRWYLEANQESVSQFVEHLIVRAAPPIYFLGFGVFVYLMLMISWSLLPAALGERTRHEDVNVDASDWLGRCLSAGFKGLIFAFALVGILFLFGFPFVLFAEYALPVGHWLNTYFEDYRAQCLYILAIGIVAVVSTKGKLRSVAPVLCTVLDVVLDVANWLRYLPIEHNPRSRICARYVSLLRYLCAWRDPRDQHGYDAVIIMAHSQGCVITADLLRFLKAEGNDPALDRLTARRGLRIHLFTMGNPLRQLYSWPLPDWYGWARDDRPQTLPLPDDLRTDEKPEPDGLLGVERWVSAYRSGDFVGRHIWRADSRTYLFDLATTVSRDTSGKREEFCIGNGAHTHYWDDTAPEIARRLDQLIAEA